MREPVFKPAQSTLRDFRYFESTDLDDTRERITHILQSHTQRLVPGRTTGRIRSHMDFIQLSNFGFCSIKYNHEMNVEVTDLAHCHVLIFCFSGNGSVNFRGNEIGIDSQRGFASNAGDSFRVKFSEDCEQFVVRINRGILATHIEGGALSLLPRIDLNRPTIAPWIGLVQALFSERNTLNLVRNNPRITQEYEQLLLSLFLEGHPHQTSRELKQRSIAPSAIRRAERYIYDHFAEPLTLLDIADAAGVPTRTLLDNFRRFRNTTPIKLLHEVRLEQARALLLKNDSEHPVSEIAAQSGFGHLGRFAERYFARFGEYPSDSAPRRRTRCN
jgi:AraC-like DNA-binding protein